MARGYVVAQQTLRSWRNIDSTPTSSEKSRSRIFFVLEYFARGEDYKIFKKLKNFDELRSTTVSVLKKIPNLGFLDFNFVLIFIWFHYFVSLAMVLCCHKKKVIQQDIKPENFLLGVEAVPSSFNF